MSPEINIQSDPVLETVGETKQIFVDLVNEIGVSQELIDALQAEILAGLTVERVEGGPCLFQNVGFIENGVPDGRYKLILSDEVLRSRANRLKDLAPPGQEDRLVVAWITAHELGHGLEAAYSHVHQYVQAEGTFAGLTTYRYPTNEYIDKFPESKMAPHYIDADRIERERRAEGFGQEVLVRELQKMGVAHHDIIRGVHKIYEPSIKRARALEPLLEMTSEEVSLSEVYDGRLDELAGKKIDPQFVKHEIGYAYPLPVDEIARRYNAV